MRKNEIFIIFVILTLFLVTLSSASAGEINSAEDLEISDEIVIDDGDTIDLNSNNNDEIIGESTDDYDDAVSINGSDDTNFENIDESDNFKEKETLSDSNSIIVTDKTFSGIQTAIDGANTGDTITLDGYYISDIEGNISVNKNLTFVGINNATLDANHSSSIFDLNKNGITFSNITFKNGNSSSKGSAIFSSRYDINILSCNFISNEASYGGAIYFSLNRGNQIYKCSIIDCSFVNNSAKGDGGAIQCRAISGNSITPFRVLNCSFVNNSAKGGGGAVCVVEGNSSFWNCSFVNNSANGDGGAIISHCMDDTSFSVLNCSFNNNAANGFGGAIRHYGESGGYSITPFRVLNCSFVNNSAKYGGAISLTDGFVVGCSFVNNSAVRSGAISTGGSDFSNCTFQNNTPDDGLVLNSYLSVNVSSSILDDDCILTVNLFDINGPIKFQKVTLNIGEGYEITTNNRGIASFNVSSVLSQVGANVTLRFNGDANHSAVIQNVSLIPSNVTIIKNKTFSAIQSAIDNANEGDIIVLEGTYSNDLINTSIMINKTLIIFGVNIATLDFTNENNSTAFILNKTVGDLTLNNIFFKNVRYGISSYGNITIKNGVFSNNGISYTGCCLVDIDLGSPHYNSVSEDSYHCSVVDCSFLNNFVNESLVNIRNIGTNSSSYIVNCSFVNNSAMTGAVLGIGGVYGFSSVVGCSFVNNSVNGDGGAIYLHGVCNLSSSVIGCSFVNNSATGSGGAVFLSGGYNLFYPLPCNHIFEGCSFVNNSASYGGAIYMKVDSSKYEGFIANCSFVNNSAITQGGAIYANASDIINCTFENNSPTTGFKYKSYLTVNNLLIILGEESNLTAYLRDANGPVFNKTVTFNVNGNNYSETTNSVGIINFNIGNKITEIGTYTIGVHFKGDEIYEYVSTYATVVVKYKPILIVDDLSIKIGEDGILAANLSFDGHPLSDEYIVFKVNGDEYESITDSNGLATFNITEILGLGKHTVNVLFEEENDYVSVSKNVTVYVRYETFLTVNNLSTVLGDNGILSANLSNVNGALANKPIIFVLDNKNVTKKTVASGLASFNVKSDLVDVGEYNVSVVFEGDDYNSPFSTYAMVHINAYAGTLTVVQDRDYYKGTSLVFNLTDNKTGLPVNGATIKLVCDDNYIEHITTNSEGIAIYDIPFVPGIYNVKATVIDSNVLVNVATLNNFVVKPRSGVIEITQNGTGYDNATLLIKVYNNQTGEVYRNVNVDLDFIYFGETGSAITNEEGIAIYNIPFGVGVYYVIASINEEYADFVGADKDDVEITKSDSILIFENDIDFVIGGSGSTNFTVIGGSISQGNITVIDHPEALININGDVITVSSLSKGVYTLQVTTTPDSNHNSITLNLTITVDNPSSTLVLDGDIVFNYGDSGSTTFVVAGGTVYEDNIVVVYTNGSVCPNAVIKLNSNEVTVSNLSAGNYYLKVSTTPDSIHSSVTRNCSVIVNRVPSAISFTDVTFDYGSNGTTILLLYGCTVDEENIRVIGSNGQVYSDVTKLEGNIVTVYNLFLGDYTLIITTTPDENHSAVTANASIKVTEFASNVIFNNNVAFDYGDVGILNITIVGATVDSTCFSIQGQNASFEVDKVGNYYLVYISNLPVGSHTLKITTIPDSIHDAVSKYCIVTVLDSNASVIKTNTSITFGSSAMKFAYSGSGSVTVAISGGTINVKNIEVVGHKEAIIKYSNGKITVSNLTVGKYTLKVTPTADAHHVAKPQSISITVTKISAGITAKALTVYYKNTKKWSIKLMDNSNKKVLANKLIVLKLYTGKKYTPYKVKTNSKGIATFNVPKTLKLGTHKVVLSYSASYTTCKALTSKIVVKKRPIKISIAYQKFEDGSNTIDINVKVGKKALNKAKVKVFIYTGKKVTKTYTKLVTGYYKYNKKSGFAMYGGGIKAFGKAGTHKIKIMSNDVRYTGTSNIITIKVPKAAKKIKTVVVTNGKFATIK